VAWPVAQKRNEYIGDAGRAHISELPKFLAVDPIEQQNAAT
jgi:hypothetical protein